MPATFLELLHVIRYTRSSKNKLLGFMDHVFQRLDSTLILSCS